MNFREREIVKRFPFLEMRYLQYTITLARDSTINLRIRLNLIRHKETHQMDKTFENTGNVAKEFDVGKWFVGHVTVMDKDNIVFVYL